MDFGALREVAGKTLAVRQVTRGLKRGIDAGQRRRRKVRKLNRKYKSFMGL